MSGSQTVPEEHDAQREMEQRSLRNVRALIDKLEEEAEVERRTRKRIGWTLVILVVLFLGGGFGLSRLRHGGGDESRVIVIPPPAAHR